jgi:shikimate dehydrogenase
LGDAVAGLRALGAKGANITTPFKTAVIPFLDEIDPLAQRLQAVNTIVNDQGRLIGYSTDGLGFWQSVPSGSQRAVLLGAGGAARAIVAAKPADVDLQVFSRLSEHFSTYAQLLDELDGTTLIDIAKVDPALATADLVINATTVGMRHEDSVLSEAQLALLPATAMVVDIIYRPTPTKLLRLAAARDLAVQDGLPMLVGQGALSFEKWFDTTAPRDVMTAAVEQENGNEGNK